jgi:hypothetical protein
MGVEKSNNASEELTTDPEKQSLKELLVTLSAKQLWGILGASFFVLATVFWAGYGLRDNLAKAEIERKQIEIDKSKKESDDIKAFYKKTDVKEEFLTLYTRYFRAKESGQGTTDAAKNMAQFLNEHLDNAKASRLSTERQPPPIRVGRGQTAEQSTIILSGDNTSWDLPQDVIKHVHQNLLNNDAILKDPAKESDTSKDASAKRQ